MAAFFFVSTSLAENLQNVIPVTDGLGRFWQTPKHSQEEVAMKIFSPDDLVALRPTWKTNLFWLFVVAVVVIAVAS
jgi:hypothetical protein